MGALIALILGVAAIGGAPLVFQYLRIRSVRDRAAHGGAVPPDALRAPRYAVISGPVWLGLLVVVLVGLSMQANDDAEAVRRHKEHAEANAAMLQEAEDDRDTWRSATIAAILRDKGDFLEAAVGSPPPNVNAAVDLDTFEAAYVHDEGNVTILWRLAGRARQASFELHLPVTTPAGSLVVEDSLSVSVSGWSGAELAHDVHFDSVALVREHLSERDEPFRLRAMRILVHGAPPEVSVPGFDIEVRFRVTEVPTAPPAMPSVIDFDGRWFPRGVANYDLCIEHRRSFLGVAHSVVTPSSEGDGILVSQVEAMEIPQVESNLTCAGSQKAGVHRVTARVADVAGYAATFFVVQPVDVAIAAAPRDTGH